MDIVQTISKNLSAWMAESTNLDTIKKLSMRSGVGFGTVQRCKNGDGNPTVTNLQDICRAFGRPIEDILRPASYATAGHNVTVLKAAEPPPVDPLLSELLSVVETLSERGIIELIGRAKEMAITYPRAKANRRS